METKINKKESYAYLKILDYVTWFYCSLKFQTRELRKKRSSEWIMS